MSLQMLVTQLSTRTFPQEGQNRVLQEMGVLETKNEILTYSEVNAIINFIIALTYNYQKEEPWSIFHQSPKNSKKK